MKYLWITLLVFVQTIHSFVVKSDRSYDSTRLGIYDGSKTSIKEHPYLVSIILTDGVTFMCAGTIVSPQWVVSVADCFYEYTYLDFYIVASSQNGLEGQRYTLLKIVTHPLYNNGKYDYNYACAKVNKKFKWSDKVKPLKLPKNQPEYNTKMVVAGWGSQVGLTNNKVPSELRQGIMKWVNNSVCKKTYVPFGVNFTDRIACGYNKNKTTLCSGDWGDAFVYEGAFYGMLMVKATYGWCTSEAPPVLLSNVRTGADWIQKITGAEYEDIESSMLITGNGNTVVF